MRQDSLFGERILWTGSPREARTPLTAKAVAAVSLGLTLVAVAFGIVQVLALGMSAAPAFLFALGSATFGALVLSLPAWWAGGARYLVTQNHVISERGPFRRTIDRRAISYARISWSPRLPGVGDLELVRAVPTGALWRRLAITLVGIENPDGVWAIVRNAQKDAATGHGSLPIAQRLDREERVLWTARPLTTLRSYLPTRSSDWAQALLTVLLVGVSGLLTARDVSFLRRALQVGLDARSLIFGALVTGLALGVLIILGLAVLLGYTTLVQRARSLHATRYLITNKRVLIQRGREELHLDRARIVDLIETRAGPGTLNVFLVLDGPRARAVATGGAFGQAERGADLLPIFECVQDGDGVRRALGEPDAKPPISHAA